MEFDVNGYPYPAGASDSEDSSHLNGMMGLSLHPKVVPFGKYIVRDNVFYFRYIRCQNSKYNFSRDQTIALFSGMIKKGHGDLVSTDYIDGIDLIPPSVHGMVRIAKNREPYFPQKVWVVLETVVHAFIPLSEPNQVIATTDTYGHLYLKFWTTINFMWKRSVRKYWGGWRNEADFAEWLIKYVEERTKKSWWYEISSYCMRYMSKTN